MGFRLIAEQQQQILYRQQCDIHLSSQPRLCTSVGDQQNLPNDLPTQQSLKRVRGLLQREPARQQQKRLSNRRTTFYHALSSTTFYHAVTSLTLNQ